MLESLVTLVHMASRQVEDPVTQGALGLRNSPWSLETSSRLHRGRTDLSVEEQ